MRKLVIRSVGAVFIVAALLALGKLPLAGLFNPGISYNGFLLVMGLLAFAAAELGGEFGRWFDFMFGIILAVLCLTSAGAWYYGTSQVYVGTIFFTGVAAVVILYAGYQLPRQIEEAERNQ